jgi:hypothetical protein
MLPYSYIQGDLKCVTEATAFKIPKVPRNSKIYARGISINFFLLPLKRK